MHFFTTLALFVLPLSALASDSWNHHEPSSGHGHGASKYHGGSHLGRFMPGPHPGGSHFPWGGRNVSNTNPYHVDNIPNTGVTRKYTWTVTNTTLAPDGVSQPMLVVNGQFPGPLVEANWGDWIEVSVTNGLEIEGTSIHWHGFLQTGTPWMDGVPGVSMCPIAPGKTFTYRFRAELYGTTWWHGHYSAQVVNGLWGPIVVHGPASDEDYDVDIGPVLLSDHFHDYYVNLILAIYYANPTCNPSCPPMSNNMLINGRANYPCDKTTLPCTPNAGLASFKFQTGKRHRLRLINTASEAVVFFSIDGYNMTVIANDLVPLEPYQTDLVTLAVGQRTDIIVEGRNDPKEAVWMRLSEGPSGLGPPAGQTGCSLNDGVADTTTAGIYYEDADTSVAPTTTSTIDVSRYYFPQACGNSPLDVTVPAYQIPAKEPDVTYNFTMSGNYNESGAFVWYLNNQTYRADFNDPTLFEAALGQTSFEPIHNTYTVPSNASTIRVVLTSVGFPASHPMHLHGHNMQILADGLGAWDGVTIVNPANPQRRDTHLVRPNGYAVLQWELDNPGVWPLHCHISWHISQGMNVNFLEGEDWLTGKQGGYGGQGGYAGAMPYVMGQTCRDWSAWTGDHVVPQIDSGL